MLRLRNSGLTLPASHLAKKKVAGTVTTKISTSIGAMVSIMIKDTVTVMIL